MTLIIIGIINCLLYYTRAHTGRSGRGLLSININSSVTEEFTSYIAINTFVRLYPLALALALLDLS